MNRRQFVVGGCSAAIAAMAGGRVGNLLFDTAYAGTTPGTDETLVVVFLRGGCDGLSLVVPYTDANYVSNRGSLVVKNPLKIDINNPAFGGATTGFGLHPNAAPLQELYQQQHLAIVHAVGLNDETRSHFDAMDYIERGTPGNKSTSSGWLTRHMQAITSDDASAVPSLAAGAAAPSSLLSDPRAISTTDPNSYSLSGVYRYTDNTGGNGKFKDAMLKTLDGFYGGSDAVQTTGKLTVNTIKLLRATPDYVPPSGVTYPSTSLGDSLKTVAQMIKLDLGLRVATVDYGGWDHHESEGVNETYGPFFNHVDELSRGLSAIYNDLASAGRTSKVTIVVQSEFGRRLVVNASGGTDHGHGNMMMVLGGNVNGGKLYGKWPGLETDNLDQREDLAITTDFRTVLSEIVVRRLGNPLLGQVFPNITADIYSTAKALNVVQGNDLALDYTTPVETPTPTPTSSPTPSGSGTSRLFLPLTTR